MNIGGWDAKFIQEKAILDRIKMRKNVNMIIFVGKTLLNILNLYYECLINITLKA